MTMKYLRDTKEYKEKQKKFIELLVEEAATGVTKMDNINGTGRCLFCPEAEAMYLTEIRNFFENSISHKIMTKNHDTSEFKVLSKTKKANRQIRNR